MVVCSALLPQVSPWRLVHGLRRLGIIVPYLHPTGGPYSVAHGAYDSLEYTISKAVFPVLVLGVIYLTGVLVGKVFCGWACPVGMLQVC